MTKILCSNIQQNDQGIMGSSVFKKYEHGRFSSLKHK
jgi:hypothetical protein